MSTDYTHFTNLAFTRLFAKGPDGSEVVLVNSSGNFVGISISGALTVGSLMANGVKVGTAANVVAHVNTLKTSSTLGIKGNTTISGTLVVSSTIGASNFSGTHSGTSSGTNTGDQTITLTGNVTGTGTGSFATTIASSVVTNVMIAPTAAIAGSKIVAASTAVAGVVTAGNQVFRGLKVIRSIGSSDAFRCQDSTGNIVFVANQGDGGTVQIGGTSVLGVHVINATLLTNGAGVLTMTNGPAGKSGNPTGYLSLTINGSARTIPFW